MRKLKIGIYGGSFSPPHDGHVKLARSFLDFVKLDRLYVIPSGNPPHKKIDGGADGEVRLEMCRAAFSALSDKVEISDYEAYRTDPCYTVDTLRHFSLEGELYMLCGSDMFLTLDRWREPQEIFRLATVVCGTRVDDVQTKDALTDASERFKRDFGARCFVMGFEPVEVSSTSVRADLLKGIKPDNICDGIFEIIKKRKLYSFGKGDTDE